MENTVFIQDERLSLGGDPPRVLARFSLPYVRENAKAPFAKSFTAYYTAMREGFLQYLEGSLVKKAEAEAAEGFKPYGGVLSSSLGLETAGLLSLYTDAVVSMGGEKRIRRKAELWHKDRGVLLDTRAVFENGSAKKLYPLLGESALRYSEKNNSPLYSDYQKQLKKHFSPQNFYLSPKGAVFFYQSGTVSPLQKPLPLHLTMEEIKPCLKGELLKLCEGNA